jgi:hypothetical protein
MLDPDPDRRASRIAPLLGKLTGDRGRTDARTTRDPPGDDARSDRFARRQARRATRRAERAARRDRRRYRGPPFPFSVILSLVFLVAMLGVSVATQVVVPIVLTVLSLFFARQAFRSAVDTVRDAGHRAVDAMDRVRRGGLGESTEEGPRVRVDQDEAGAPSARVGNADEPPEEEEDDEPREKRRL